MKLNRRVSTYVAAIMAALSAVLLIAAATALLVTAMRTDERSALEESQRAHFAIANQLRTIVSNTLDWSMWDDTFRFVGGKNPGYVAANLAAGTPANLGVNLIAVYDRSGSSRAMVVVDLKSGNATSIAGITDLVASNPQLNLAVVATDTFSGVLSLPGGRLLLTGAGAIKPSDRRGKASGTLVMGRLLDAGEVSAIAQSTQLDLSVSPASASSLSPKPAETLTANTITVMQPILGASGVPLAEMRVTRPRSAWKAALQSLAYLGLAIVALVAGTTVLIRRGVHRIVLTRLTDLNESVNRIRSTGRPESLTVPGGDELSSLADNVGSLVAELDESRSLVEQSRGELEARVQQRTEDLSHAVDDLTAQIRRRQEAEDARDQSERRYEVLIENLSDVVFTMCPDGTLEFVSSAVSSMFGVDAEQISGQTIEALLGEHASSQVLRRVKRGLTEDGAHLTIDGCSSHGGPLDLDVVLTPIMGSTSVQGILRDVTARRRHENELLHMASHDFLTGLWNRRRFEDELARSLARLENGGGPGAILWLDLDGFKEVNDSRGHKAGDELLGIVARTLRESVRSDCIVARLGGDEFAVLLPASDGATARATAERLVNAIADVRMELEGRVFRASTSLGVVLYPEHGTDVQELLSRADIAMYQAKDLGRSRFAMFDPADEWRGGVEDSRAWIEMIELALTNDGLVVYAQPICDLASGELVSYEFLVRMVDVDGSLISPDRFLPVAERTGMIVDIDIWMLHQAAAMLARQPDETYRLNVNASPRTLADPRFLDALTELVAGTSIDPSRLTIEITETAIIVDVASISDALRRIKSLGCRIALDDFGSGFTSFLHLKQLPVDDIKIDGSFVRGISDNPNDQHLVRAMVEMAKGLSMQTTAEFVETRHNIDLLRSLGVEMVQGYVLGHPAPAEEVIAAFRIHSWMQPPYS